jgi:hypothetical protein
MPMRDEVYFKIEGLPVSENKAVRMSSRGGYKTKEFKEWEELVALTQKNKTIDCSEWYGCEIIVHMPLYCKNGSIKRRDSHNFIKYAIDTTLKKVADVNGKEIDDCRIIEVSECKVDDKNEWTEITFYCIG